ncbi:hypothetical protein B566_EDAN010861 [Ephemera danica]|nr:hypothetical protein B566_EDAN010861 [Ephemera danica]
MGMTRAEINLRRLLGQCEQLAKESDSQSNWRIDKYVGALDELFLEVEKQTLKPSKEAMTEYIRRIEFLKGLRMTEKLTSVPEKVVAAQLLSHGPVSPGSEIVKEIQQKTRSKYNTELRDQLFQTDRTGNAENEGARQRKRQSSSTGEDLDALLKYHHSMQEKIAEDMLSLARNLKEQTLLANTIIHKDTKSIEKSQNLADKNADQLKLESERLQEHSRRACKCWLWVMIIIVLTVFICMVLFMRVMKKKI